MNEDFRSGLDEDLAAELRRIAAETGNSEEQVLCMALFFLRRQLGEAREQLDHERADADLRAALDAERAKVAALAAALAFYADRETWRGEFPKAPIHRDCDGDMAAVPGLRARIALAGTDPAAWDRGQQTAEPELRALLAAYDRWRAACAGKPERK